MCILSSFRVVESPTRNRVDTSVLGGNGVLAFLPAVDNAARHARELAVLVTGELTLDLGAQAVDSAVGLPTRIALAAVPIAMRLVVHTAAC
jgi:spore maturation protein SpmA